MPIIIPENLSTRWMLDSEGIFVIEQPSALRQDVRPLQIAIVDPGRKHRDEISRMLSQSPLQIELTFISATSTHDELGATLHPVQLEKQSFDGLIIADHPGTSTQDPDWDEFRDIIDWAVEHVHAHLYLGNSALAAIRHFYNVPQSPATDKRASRLVDHHVLRVSSFLLRGFNDDFQALVRDAHGMDRETLLDVQGLELLAASHVDEPYLLRSYDRRRVFLLHFPSEADAPHVVEAQGTWRTHRSLLVRNWINYYVYQPVSHVLRERDGRPAA